MSDTYQELCERGRQSANLDSVSALMGWDQETYMPAGGSAARAEQAATLAAIRHDLKTDPRVGELIEACESNGMMSDPDSPEAANVREFRRDYDLATKLPKDLVTELAKTSALGQEAWKSARADSDFATFKPWLEKLVGLARRKAECYGAPAGGELYDALLDIYEPGSTSAEIESAFVPLGKRLGALVAELAESGTPPETDVLGVEVPADRQHAFGLFVLDSIGFDLKSGRLDITTHPFCEGLAPGDTRLTTRYRDEHFTDALYGTMHEAGHGIYEQNLPKGGGHGSDDRFGQPLSQAISLGIHESQSRMWENFVGRSRAFWEWALPHAQKMLGGALDNATPEQLYRAVNTASPSFIRVEADELTYNLHILIRFEMERAIIGGDLEVGDIPAAWNEKYKTYLGVEVPDDRRGCLQDIHWSGGMMGYFPTYCLGNLYAAQLWETINVQIPDLESQIGRGEFGPLKSWLAKNIHHHGRRYRAGDLCQKLTGKPLGADPLLRHLEGKLKPIFGLG